MALKKKSRDGTSERLNSTDKRIRNFNICLSNSSSKRGKHNREKLLKKLLECKDMTFPPPGPSQKETGG